MTVDVLFGSELRDRADDLERTLEPAVSYCNEPLMRQLPLRLPRSRRAIVFAARSAADAILDDAIAARICARTQEDMLDALLAQFFELAGSARPDRCDARGRL